MNYQQQAPAEAQGVQGQFDFGYKDSEKFSRAKVRQRVYKLFLTGRRLTAADITFSLGLCDPRAHIRDLRHRGVNILDYWSTSTNGNKCKVYYLSGGRDDE